MSVLGKVIAFHAWHTTNPLKVASSGTLILNHAVTNIGNAYNTQTGIFTVPVDGLYDFQATFMPNKSTIKTAFVGLFVDNNMMAEGVSDSSHNYWDQSTIRAVVHVKKNQRVWLKNMSNPADLYVCTAEPYSTFSGFLIRAD